MRPAAAAAISIVLAVCTVVPAPADPGLGVEAPKQLRIVHINDQDYDVDFDEAIPVGGTIGGFTYEELADSHSILINGHPSDVIDTAQGPRYGDRVALGGDPPWWFSEDRWPKTVPYVGWFKNPHAVLIPVLIELIDTSDQTVVARRRVTVRDKRHDPDLDFESAKNVLKRGLTSQVTLAGIERLEQAHSSSLPHPDLAHLNGEIDEREPPLAIRQQFPAPRAACFPLKDDERFTELDEYKKVLDDAQQQNRHRKNLLRIADQGGPQAQASRIAAELLCVQHEPEVRDFEICVRRIDGDITDIHVGAWGGASLLPPQDPDSLGSGVTLADIDTDADAWLREITFRWKSGKPVCAPRPTELVDPRTIEDTEWLDAWATCSPVEVEAGLANSRAPGVMPFRPYKDRPEELAVWHSATPEFDLFEPELISEHGTCAQNWVKPEVLLLLERFVPQIESTLAGAWADGAPETKQSDVLELLLSAHDIGAQPVEAVDPALPYRLARGIPDVGLRFAWASDVRPIARYDQGRESKGWVYREESGHQWHPDGNDPTGDAFHASYSLTTGFLNQLLRAFAATDRWRDDIRPSWSDLRSTPPSGQSRDDPAELTAERLSKVIPQFKPLRGPMDIRLRPTLDPFVLMPPDGGWDGGDAPLTLQLGQLEVDFVMREGQGRPVLTLAIDLFAPSLRLGFDPEAGSDRLRAEAPGAWWAFTALVNDLPGCPMKPHLVSNEFRDSCERDLEAVAGLFVRRFLEDRLMGVLSDIPAPQWFDARGESEQPRQQRLRRTYQERQWIRLYGELQ